MVRGMARETSVVPKVMQLIRCGIKNDIWRILRIFMYCDSLFRSNPFLTNIPINSPMIHTITILKSFTKSD
jgi:hypothetical protein